MSMGTQIWIDTIYVYCVHAYPKYKSYWVFHPYHPPSPQTSGKFRIRLYERPDFAGQMMEFSEDNPNLPEHWHHPEVHSCNVMDGAWVFYEHPNYRGHQHLLERGEYRHFNDWRSNVGSIRRVQNL